MEFTKSPEQIVADYRQRSGWQSSLQTRSREIRDTYNGEAAFPLPETMAGEKSMYANLLNQGIDGTAQRIASTFYDLLSPALKRGQDLSERRAADRRRAAMGWMEMSNLRVRHRRRARHLISYASSPVMIRPDRKRKVPRWQVRDPLCTYPAPTSDFEDVEPADCIFAVQRDLRWLLQNYPEKIAELHVGPKADHSDLYDVLEYVDAEQITLIVIGKPRRATPAGGMSGAIYSGVGKRITAMTDGGSYGASEIVVLEQLPNRAGICTAVVPWRITLDKPIGQMDSMLGPMYWESRLGALEILAVERGVFADEWIVYPTGDGKVVVVANGREGVLGEIRGGQFISQNVNPGYKTSEARDRLERAQRQNGRVPAEMGGESGTNIRTDRRGLSVLSNAIDFNSQEVQELFELSAEKELERAVAVDKGHFGNLEKSFYVSWSGAQGPVKYTPNQLFEDGSILKPRYAMAGTDAVTLAGVNAQKVGARQMSRRTSMEQDPTIPDVPAELERIESQEMRDAVLAAYAQQAASGQVPWVDALKAARLREQGKDLLDALEETDRAAQDRQAAPVAPGAPEAMPGMSMPGMGAEAGGGAPAAPAAQPSIDDLLGQLVLPGGR